MSTHPTTFPLGRARGEDRRVRLVVRLRRHQLEDRLLRGDDPSTDPALGLRARQLGSTPVRDDAAQAIERVLEAAAAERKPRLSAAVPLRRAAIRADALALRQLVMRLRSSRPVDPVGVALARRLVTDGDSPLYVGGDRRPVRADAWRVLDALDGQS